jgi:hypothetical protein
MTAGQALVASVEAAPVLFNVRFTAQLFQAESGAYEPPAREVSGRFSFDFDTTETAGGFTFTPACVVLVIAEGTEFETNFSGKALSVGVQWNGHAFERIRFYAGSPEFYAGSDDFILELFPEGGGQDSMRYALSSALSTYRSTHISFVIPEGDCYEPDNTPGKATRIDSGSVQTHSIVSADDVDWFKFTLVNTSDILLETSGSAGDTRLWLYDSIMTQIAFNDDIEIGNNLFSRISRKGMYPGTYYAKVDEHGNDHVIERYLLSLRLTREQDQYEPDNTPDQARPILLGSARKHNIVPADDVDWVKFTLANSASLLIKFDKNVRFWLYDSHLQIVPTTTYEYPEDNIGYVKTRLVPGTYYAKLDGDGEISRYLLTMEARATLTEDPYEPDNTPDQAKTIRYRTDYTDAIVTAQRHSIVPTDDVDWVKFTLANTADIRLKTHPSDSVWDAHMDTRLWLFDSNMTQIAFNNDDAGQFAQIKRSGLPPGTYYAKVDEYRNNKEGVYRLFLQATQEEDKYEPDNTPDQAKTIQYGSAQTHSIIPKHDVDWVKFTLAEPSDIVLETSGSAGDTRLWLYDGNLKPIDFNDDIYVGHNLFSKIFRRGLAPGTYYAKVDEYWNDRVNEHLIEHEIDRYRLSLNAMQEPEKVNIVSIILLLLLD